MISEAEHLDYLSSTIVERQIWERVHIGKMNQIILVDGMPRTGKSELCLKLAETLDPTFTVDRIAWKSKNFLKLTSEAESKGHQVTMWDEAGIADWGANARQFWSEGNMSASTLFQTMGFKENIAIINLPMKLMLDKHVRSLIHVNIKTIKVMPRKAVCRAKTFFLHPSDDGKFVKTIYPRVNFGGIKYRVKTQLWRRPSVELRKAYKKKSEIIKQELQEKLNAEAILREEAAGYKITSSKDMGALCKAIADNIEGYWDYKKDRVIPALIQLNLKVGRNLARQVANVIMVKYQNGEINP